MKNNFVLLVFAAAFFTACKTTPVTPVTGSAANAMQTGYAKINGLTMYYEIHGESVGVPLILLNGGGSTIESNWSRVLPILARNRRVIALDEQAHGRTSDRNGPVTFEGSADDVVALMDDLKIEKADVFGFSNGASVGLQIAIRHPERVRKLVFASSFSKRSGAPDQFWTMMKRADFAMMPQPLKDAFLKVNPDPEKLRVMHDKDAKRMQTFKDVPDKSLRVIAAPVLVLQGDHDLPTLAHAVELTKLIPKSRLVILPGGHGDYLGEVAATTKANSYPLLTAGLVAEFLADSTN